MSTAREHAGHRSDAAQRIQLAREHYESRTSRRPRQTWIVRDSWDHSQTAEPRGARGAVAVRS